MTGEERVEAVLSTLPDKWELDIYHHIRRCAALLDVKPAKLNLAIECVTTKTLDSPADVIRNLLLILEYLKEV